MVIDAMDILHGGKFDGFVLVSSDSDFTALANRLREDGLNVIGIGEAKTPQSLRNVCNRFILIENISPETSAEAKARPTPESKPYPKPVKVLPLFKDAFDKMETEDGWYNLGPVGSRIIASRPDFDPRSYGHKKLSDLVKALKDLDTKTVGTRLLVRLKP